MDTVKVKMKSVVYGFIGIGIVLFVYNTISAGFQDTLKTRDTVFVDIDTSSYHLIGTIDEDSILYSGPIAGSQPDYKDTDDTVYIIRYIEEEQFTKDTGEYYMGIDK